VCYYVLAPDLDRHAILLLAWPTAGLAYCWLGWIAPSLVMIQPPSSRAMALLPRSSAPRAARVFLVELWRCKVKPTFASLPQYRRLRVNDGMSHASSRLLASVFMIGMRLERMFQP
jgi:hypothetical protein